MRRIRKPSSRVLAIVSGVLVAVVAAQTAVIAVTVTRNGGPVTAVRTKTNDGYDATGSMTYATVPGMRTTVSVPNGEQALLVITFSATSLVWDDGTDGYESAYGRVRVQVDGATVTPGDVVFDSALDGDEAALEANSLQWVAAPVAAGDHVIRVQYRVDEDDGTFAIYNPTLTVLRSRIG